MFYLRALLIITVSVSFSQCFYIGSKLIDSDWTTERPPFTESTDEGPLWTTPDTPTINITTTPKPPPPSWTTPDAPGITITTTIKPPPPSWTTPDVPILIITTTVEPPIPDFTTPDSPIVNITTTDKPPPTEWVTPDAPEIDIDDPEIASKNNKRPLQFINSINHSIIYDKVVITN